MKIVCDLSVTSAPHRMATTNAPWFTPWQAPISGAAPGLVLDFAAGAYGVGGSAATLASVMALTRASEGTRTASSGALEVIGANQPRIEHDAQTHARLGLLLEDARTNLFANSSAPADQTINVSSVPHVLSFYGTGTIALSGAHVASITGTGAYPARTTLAFTPAAGALSVAISGAVSSVQLEEGDTASSFVPSGATATARAEDVATVALGSWFNASEGTLVFSGSLEGAAANDRIIEIDSGTSSTRLSILWNTVLGKPQFQVWQAGALQAAIAPAGNSIGFGAPFRVAVAYGLNDFAVSMNGGALATDNSGILPTGLGTLRLGRSIWGAQGLMLAESVVYYPARLADAELLALSA